MIGEDRPASTAEHRLGGTQAVSRRGSGVRVWRASAEMWPCGLASGPDDALRLQETAIRARTVGGFWPAAGRWIRTQETEKLVKRAGAQAPADSFSRPLKREPSSE